MILVINARGAAMTLVATVKGIVEFRPDSTFVEFSKQSICNAISKIKRNVGE